MHMNEFNISRERGSADILSMPRRAGFHAPTSPETYRHRTVLKLGTLHLLKANRTLKYLMITAFASLSILLASCSSESFVDLASLKSSLNLKTFPGRKQYPNADAVILSNVHDVQAMIDRDGDVETNESVTKVIKLLRNVDEHASVQLEVYSGQSIFGLKARTIEPDGKSIVLSKRDFHIITGAGSDYIFYSDEKKIRFTFPAVQKNCVIEYHYGIHETHPFVQDVWQIQSRYPELINTYRLTVPVLLLLPPARGGYGWNWRYKIYNSSLGKPEYEQDADADTPPSEQTVTLTWTKRNIPAFKPDPMMPPALDYIKYVKFAPSAWKTWNDISRWYYGYLFKPQLEITPDIVQKAKDLTRGCHTDSQRIEKLFDYVQSLRYVAVELGEGGYQPSKPETVMRKMYGDCKDKSILLISLLRSLEITARPVLVLTSDEGEVDPDFPSWMFNHMIVKARTRSGKSYWLDATADHCALGELPYMDQGTNALVLNYDNTSRIETIPSSTFTQNGQNMVAHVNVDTSGTATFSVAIQFNGEENLEARSFLTGKSRDEIVAYCKSLVARNFLNVHVKDYSFINIANPDTSLIMRIRIKAAHAMRDQEGLNILDIDPFRISGDWTWLSANSRKYPMDFGYPRLITKTIDVSLPSGYSVSKLPSKIVSNTAGLYFTKYYTLTDSSHFIISESLAITGRFVSHKDYQKVRNFAEKMLDASETPIALYERGHR